MPDLVLLVSSIGLHQVLISASIFKGLIIRPEIGPETRFISTTVVLRRLPCQQQLAWLIQLSRYFVKGKSKILSILHLIFTFLKI